MIGKLMEMEEELSTERMESGKIILLFFSKDQMGN